MHTLTNTIQQQTDAITQHVNAASERLQQHLERTSRRLIVHMTIFILAAQAVAFMAYTLG